MPQKQAKTLRARHSRCRPPIDAPSSGASIYITMTRRMEGQPATASRRYASMQITSLYRTAALLVALLATVLSGCATPSLSKNQCLEGDWRRIGFDDGRAGFTPSRVDRHTEACEELGIVPNGGDYRAGWNDGVRGFCTSGQGLRNGQAGESYHGLCPPDLEPAFLSGYDQGLKDFCVPAHGYDAGRFGNAYRGGVCPPALEFAYRRAYEDGQRVQRAHQRYRERTQQLDETARARQNRKGKTQDYRAAQAAAQRASPGDKRSLLL